MTAILSPKPRRAPLIAQPLLARPAPLLSPPIYLSTDLPRSTALFSPPRLMSPVNITSSGIPKSNLSKAPPSCSSAKRRRPHNTTSRSSRRRLARPDCSAAFGPSFFDSLPWISQVECAPERVDVWDVADLSLLPDEPLHQPPSSGVGPVRRRRTSTRSAVAPSLGGPVENALQASRSTPRTPLREYLQEPLPIRLLPAADRDVLDPRTPSPTHRFDPHTVVFHHLMPLLPSSDPSLLPSPRGPAWTRPTPSPPPV
ncbi:hypothetical protein PHLGIDRAFT_126160 [Phlebiopsis gigantea 11061_1 CR5-6]|uniref:Uncharacterized protein n=1 Tax=Phlebiopsis gigantea (strain 11061_1 CR5-6) TaxID=745531 RepID=A0A0C3SDC5_PHLG1|nr:hypothetical protein PHLGIDRAFT_126160 [Phlebiopsis gigantea 11061_1 CR5-6]